MSEEKKKAKRCPANQLSLEYLRAQGRIADNCDRKIHIPTLPFPKTHDMFNIFDIVFIDPEHNQVGFVQTTGWSSRGARKAKMLSDEPIWPRSKYVPADVMMALHNITSVKIELHAWRKVFGQWEVTVYGPQMDKDLNGELRVILAPTTSPSMKEARAQGRERAEERQRVVRRL